MHELITEIEKSIGLPPNWKCYPTIYKKYEWIDRVTPQDQNLIQKLETKISDLEHTIEKMKQDFHEIYHISNHY